MVQPAATYVPYEDYLANEQGSALKHEWLDGVVYAMAGGTLEHSRLAVNMSSALRRLFPSCEVFSSDAMIFVRGADLSTYADVAMVCGSVEAQKVERGKKSLGEALLNPTVIVEVLSDSTEAYDRGEKFGHYMKLASLRAYVLVAQSESLIEAFHRPARGHWIQTTARAGETLELLGVPISVDDVYRRAGG